ncbi:MAG: fatty acid desaturase family protein, partial [Bacteroidota bacterium]
MKKLSTHSYLLREERQALLKKDDLRASLEIARHLVLIIAAFVLVGIWPNALSIIVALFILGGQQLACAILMHDCAHRSMFVQPKWNDWVGKWLGAYPIFQDMLVYRPYHIQHHIHTGTADDPDLLLTRGYPTSRQSMLRKISRDLLGMTGLKTYAALLGIHLGFLTYNTNGQLIKVAQTNRSFGDIGRAFWNKLSGPILTNVLLYSVLALLGQGWLYSLWVIAMLTTFQFSLRIRSMAEHAMVKDTEDPIRNTRTTYASLIER